MPQHSGRTLALANALEARFGIKPGAEFSGGNSANLPWLEQGGAPGPDQPSLRLGEAPAAGRVTPWAAIRYPPLHTERLQDGGWN